MPIALEERPRYSPAEDSETVDFYLDGMREAKLKEKFGWGTGLPKLPREGAPREQLAWADALREKGLEKKADRAEICNRAGEVFKCGECGRGFVRRWGCKLRSCADCASRIFRDAFAKLLPLEQAISISPALHSLRGWNWKIVDHTFRHEGRFASRDQMRKMRVVGNRTVDRALRETCSEMYRARRGCRLRFHEEFPMLSADGWPVVSAPDGSARVLKGWVPIRVGPLKNRPTCSTCGSRVKKIKGELARLCPHCGPRMWPDWENQKIDNRPWRLRFGFVHIAVSEFGYSKETGAANFNYHFHGAFFGPYLENRPSCARCGLVLGPKKPGEERSWNCSNCGVVSEVVEGRLTQIFMEESKKMFGVESRGVWIEKGDFQSVLAHALKYTSKAPAKTPDGRAEYEQVLEGVRRYAVRGFLQGVQLQAQRRGKLQCPCKHDLEPVRGLGIVPLSEVEDIPFVANEKGPERKSKMDEEFCFYESGEKKRACRPRAPC